MLLSVTIGVLLLLFAGCKKKEEGKVTVTTKSVAEITANSAKCGGKVTLTGNAEVGVCGVCWSESPSPTTGDFFTTDIVGAGEYISTMNSLKQNTKYFVRAYATLNSVVMYGEEMDFTTLSDGGGNGGGTGGDGTLSVTTNDVSEITASSAICGGNVIANGEVTVSARGVCWSTSHTPTLENAHTNDGQGDGAFTSNLTGLAASTVYYVRAYATTGSGTTTYGDEKIFTTENGGGGGGTQGDLPTVVTQEVTDITGNSARCSGEVTSDGGDAVTARGICWSTSPNPTLGNNTAFGGMGTGSFTTQMTNLEIGTTYYVKAYATNSVGTAYGNEISFTTKGLPPQGAINGLFSVSENKKVYFSQGNLQYQASTNTWRFAEHQWDYIGGDYSYPGGSATISGTINGSNNSNISSTYSGWIDKFGWGTSGRNHGAVCYQPWSTSTSNSDYFAYGSSNSNLSDYTNEADWGYNAISNGGNQIGLWRTLTQSEWDYVLFRRQTNSNMRFVKATVNNVIGLILLPDNWNASTYSFKNVNGTSGASCSDNVISATTWANVLQPSGIIFLPPGEERDGTKFNYGALLGNVFQYWSSTNSSDDSSAYVLFFRGDSGDGTVNVISCSKAWGLSVRLVYDY